MAPPFVPSFRINEGDEIHTTFGQTYYRVTSLEFLLDQAKMEKDPREPANQFFT